MLFYALLILLVVLIVKLIAVDGWCRKRDSLLDQWHILDQKLKRSAVGFADKRQLMKDRIWHKANHCLIEARQRLNHTKTLLEAGHLDPDHLQMISARNAVTLFANLTNIKFYRSASDKSDTTG